MQALQKTEVPSIPPMPPRPVTDVEIMTLSLSQHDNNEANVAPSSTSSVNTPPVASIHDNEIGSSLGLVVVEEEVEEKDNQQLNYISSHQISLMLL